MPTVTLILSRQQASMVAEAFQIYADDLYEQCEDQTNDDMEVLYDQANAVLDQLHASLAG